MFFATDNVQWLPNTLHSAFPRTGDEVQQLWLLQYCTGRRPHAAAADRAGCWEWSRNRAAYPAPVSYATLERRPTLLLQQIMMGNTWPKNWSQNTLDGNIKRGPVQNKFSSSRPSVSFKNKYLSKNCWSWVPHTAAVLRNLILSVTLVFPNVSDLWKTFQLHLKDVPGNLPLVWLFGYIAYPLKLHLTYISYIHLERVCERDVYICVLPD